MDNQNPGKIKSSVTEKESGPIMRYCLYARKSSEDEERQAMSIDSQVKEMSKLAEEKHLSVVAVKTEAHSAKNSGDREVFNKIIDEIKAEKYNAILTWNPDRLSRNAGDLGRLIDLMDNKQLLEIRTFNQTFTNSPNEKFLLMILGGEAKLENDNKSLNVKRGLRTMVEKGLWPGVPPLGYKACSEKGKEGQVKIDPSRGYVVKMMFEKAAEGWSQRHIKKWLAEELNFVSPNGKHIAIATVQLTLRRPFYYGEFEYPLKSGNWYKGAHQPIITKELFDKARVELQKHNRQTRIFKKDFAYTHLMKCGLCGSSVTAEEKYKVLKDGSVNRHVYYACDRAKDMSCKREYVSEEDLVNRLCDIIDELTIDELGVRGQMDLDVNKMYRFYKEVVGNLEGFDHKDLGDLDTKKYMKFLLKNGSISEQRQVLSHIKSRLILKDGKVLIDKTSSDKLLKDTPPITQPL